MFITIKYKVLKKYYVDILHFWKKTLQTCITTTEDGYISKFILLILYNLPDLPPSRET